MQNTYVWIAMKIKKSCSYAKHVCLNCNEIFLSFSHLALLVTYTRVRTHTHARQKKNQFAMQNTYVWIAMKFFSKKSLLAMQNTYVWIAMKFFNKFSHAPLALLDKRTHTHMRIGKKKYRCYAKHACLNCNENFSKKSLLAIQNTYVWIAMKFFNKFSHAPLALLTYTRVRTHTCVGKKNLVAMQNIYAWIAMKFYLVFIGIQTHAFCIATRLSWMYVKCVWF